MYYLLREDKTAYKVPMLEWALAYDKVSRKVERTPMGKRSFVSTVFLGLDHSYNPEPGAAPVLFETMAFNNDWNEIFTRRYCHWSEAVQGHAEVVKEFHKYLRENGSRNQREGRYMDRLKKRKQKQ